MSQAVVREYLRASEHRVDSFAGPVGCPNTPSGQKLILRHGGPLPSHLHLLMGT